MVLSTRHIHIEVKLAKNGHKLSKSNINKKVMLTTMTMVVERQTDHTTNLLTSFQMYDITLVVLSFLSCTKNCYITKLIFRIYGKWQKFSMALFLLNVGTHSKHTFVGFYHRWSTLFVQDRLYSWSRVELVSGRMLNILKIISIILLGNGQWLGIWCTTD